MKYLLMIFSMLWLMVGCNTPTEDFVEVEKDELYLGYEASTVTLRVNANGWWTASSDADWCDVTTENGKLIIDVEFNEGELRTAHITVGGDGITKFIYVSQRAYGVDAYVEVAERDMVVSSLADTLYIAVDASAPWTLEVEPQEDEWCSWVKWADRLVVTYPTNMGKARTSTAHLVCEDIVTTVTLTQQACENVLVAYFMGSNNLSQALRNNISQMEKAVKEGALKGGRILIFMDEYVGSSIYELVDKGGECSRTMLKNYNTIDCTDAEVMRSVLRDIKELAPAQHYGFVFGGHATGWVADSLDMSNMNNYTTEWTKYRRQSTLDNEAELEHYGLWMKRHVEGDWKTRALGYDGSQGMDITKFAEALSELNPDFVLMDACFMASVEALWELRAVTNKVIASPIEIMSAGFPYTPIIKSLFGDWNNLAELCRIYIDSYKISWAPHAAVSLVDLTQLDALAESVADVLQSARKIEKNWLSSVNELQYYEGLVNHVFYDLGDCMNKIATDSAALGRFDRALGRVVLFEDHTDMGYSDFCRGEYPLKRCSGLSVYVARKNFPKFRASYLQTGWSQNAGEICYE
ncbi:MAG: hypothetical protein J6R87_04640 [Rikenellaceae bacterium]|nr:hypothetical protein [Rikenellaceae bacterium]